MSDLAEVLGRLERAGEAIERAVSESGGGERAKGLARALRLLWPGARLSACRLAGIDGEFRAAVGADGLPCDAPDGAFDAPGDGTLRGTFQGQGIATTLVADPPDGGEDDAALIRLCAREAGLLLERRRLLAIRRRAGDLIELGELAGPVMHEFNNLLNSLSLRLAVLEQELGGDSAASLDRIRARAAETAALVGRFQAHRKSRAAERVPIDLRRLIGEASLPPGILLAEGEVPAVVGDEVDLRNLLTFLLRFSASYAPDRPVTASVTEEGGRVTLRMEAAGPPPRQGTDYFTVLAEPAGQATGLELAACRSITQRGGGRIRAEELPGNRVALLIELPVAPRTG